MDPDRYDRQRRLREVGEEGQLRIEHSSHHSAAAPHGGVSMTCALLRERGP